LAKNPKMQKQLAGSNRNLLVLIKKCVFYTLHKYPQVFTKIEQFIKIQPKNLTPECEDLFKDTLFAPFRKNRFYIEIEQ